MKIYVKIIRDSKAKRPYRLLFKRSTELRRWPQTNDPDGGGSPDFASLKEARNWIEDKPALTLVSAWHEAEENA